MDTRFRLFPDQASTISHEIDALYFFLVAVTAFFTILIAALIIGLAFKYRRRSEVRPGVTLANMTLELTWTVIPLGIVMIMFVWAATLYVRLSRPPADAMEVFVIGKQWMWKVQHPDGRREINELHVPLGRAVRLTMISQDVIHSFYIPAFRIKQDVLPGSYSTQWFTADRIGEYHLFCAEYCGQSHSQMIGKVTVMEPADYQRWLAGVTSDEPPRVAGQRLFTQFGCAQCHGQQAPTMAGLYGRNVLLENGSAVTADDDYLRRAILEANAEIVAGYQPTMPSYRGQLSEEQVLRIIAYIKSLGMSWENGSAHETGNSRLPDAPETRPAVKTEPDTRKLKSENR